MLLSEVDRSGLDGAAPLVPRGRSPCVVPTNWVHAPLLWRCRACAGLDWRWALLPPHSSNGGGAAAKGLHRASPSSCWSEEDARQVLGDVCAFDYIDPVSFTQENTEVSQCWVWTRNPDLLPRSKATTFFSNTAGRSRPGVTAPPPKGGYEEFLVHLERYFDWTPQNMVAFRRSRVGERSPPLASRYRDPARRDDEGWERRRSRSPVPRRCTCAGRVHGVRSRSRSPARSGPGTPTEEDYALPKDSDASGAGHHGWTAPTPFDEMVDLEVAPGAPPPPRVHPDPLLDYLTGLCQEPGLQDSYLGGKGHDPMLVEFACVAVDLHRPLTFSPPPSPTDAASETASVDELVALAGDAAGPETGSRPINGPEVVFGPGVQLGQDDNQMDQLAGLLRCTAWILMGQLMLGLLLMRSSLLGILPTADEFLEDIFVDPPAAVVPASPPRRALAAVAAAPESGRRQSDRLRARPSSVPVSRRATRRLVRQLDLKTAAALAAVTRIASDAVMEASAALAAEAEAAQVEAA
ncbi:hypothetical protein C2845_PM07G35210 [Panicum miliaceum]|uniref:Uncharacterized protein n=1 Tax=Panicum miliaceum TaxID=4540 RepID=A0A3L6SRX1_PANMI|nr:hypothetical protein C2845_PM07G35210 [Panicum miliaceum]